MAARFEVRHQTGKGYHFVLIAVNGQVIATSEHYESHRACLDGIDSVKRNADAPIQDTTPPAPIRAADRRGTAQALRMAAIAP
ncbi:YegP family protein [Streptomyces virginiae]|uniref:YegP family protein n=1 Tax=Streptomyces virginiae TaxID=1961 RepID=UPI002E342F39|nr:YegP family protein [Streptomyces virginiae]